ncbi:transglutaminase family protein [Pseudomaricurvus alcaniphilus]|uniref:transglutaminase family protein n=1 Tax=Pseudomaricurvus alcaniphilus TaxID=1166482 RepID=UPI00140E9089|nr:transglutaminase family protein [Pseudomaricurvus alcaniphilus]NHN37006.1 transglutaminase family protein [Pseudomaricurvus alcaniphilus]
MTIRVALNHNTYYKFDRLVNLSPHTVRLRPAPHSRTPIHSYSLKVEPANHFINWQQDAYGNFLARLVFPEKTDKFSVEVEVQADMTVINPFDFFLEDYAQKFPFKYPKQLRKELGPYLEKIPQGPLFKKLLKSISLEERSTNDFLVEVNQQLQQMIKYLIRLEPGVQTPEETLALGKGSCRDSAWLMAQLLRYLGLATRFASGYLVQLKPDEKSLDGPSGAEEDFTDLHAWCEVYLPGAGWVGLDPTSGLFASEGHIPLACTPDPVSAAPIDGFTDKCEVEFDYINEVSRILEDPRVTKPYTDDQWADILLLGDEVDKELVANDVRLTMGGEPTFVSIDDMESAQWNTAALGEQKLSLSKTLLLKLRDHFAPNGLLHYGQGKWYPGEEVPRWALGVFWRKDKEPFWQNPKLLARVDKDYGHTIKTAKDYTLELAKLLGVSKKFAQPAYEDALHYLLQERKLPVNIDTAIGKAKDSGERARLASILERGLKNPSGYIIPLEWDPVGNCWNTCLWETRRDRLTLIPGDSPMGLRLPLGELPWSAEQEVPVTKDPFEPAEPLQKRAKMSFPMSPVKEAQLYAAPQQVSAQKHKSEETAEEQAEALKLMRPVIRTTLCIEPRNGKLHIFMPPLYSLDNYVELIAAVEEAAAKLNTPVIIEGYEPPRDYRMQKLLVTPDPGVIEVNVHPTTNWRELMSNTVELYAAARESRLGTEKFMLDGRHTGTGGGNHITLGGPTPGDSPLLRRPDLLRSFVTFWQHHPSLSYVFSGAFVGPTSQAPRPDEGRDEMLYEMETAFQQMPEGLADQPWLIDRLMRNLLIDITGNTHRAEFCIDKLYSPDGPAGRLGILEFRGFEMPPHSRMALVQALLIRTMVARFWKEPYKKPLVRWGTQLHDKFMLPHYLWKDMQEVVADLNDHGYPFKVEWLLPFEEFRFPHYGRTDLDGIEIELRWAVEPWNVLGEESGSFGTARYVDSSVERLQVKVYGMTDSRYVLACNGRRVPLSSTGRKGEAVAGVRYKAWAPPSALHPTIGVQTPLVFDLIDTWNGRSIGGCTYHVSHPGGRSYETFPVNAFEAESRRGNRFDNLSHTPGPYTPRPEVDALREFFPVNHPPRPMAPPPEESPDEYPHTLDLRRKANWQG